MVRKGKAFADRMLLDKLLRRAVIARDGLSCKMKSMGGACGGPLGVAHLLPKGAHPALRHELDNVVLACWRHHLHVWHKNPLLAMAWAARELGPKHMEKLEELARLRKGTGHSKTDKMAVRLYLEAEIERLEKL